MSRRRAWSGSALIVLSLVAAVGLGPLASESPELTLYLALSLLIAWTLWWERGRAERMAAITAPVDPAIPPLPPMGWLLASDEALHDLRGRVREVRTFSAPVYRGSPEHGMLHPCYCSVLIDANGEVHDLEDGESFAQIEERAQQLADRLGVPFESGI